MGCNSTGAATTTVSAGARLHRIDIYIEVPHVNYEDIFMNGLENHSQ
jgi:hypothetical protein